MRGKEPCHGLGVGWAQQEVRNPWLSLQAETGKQALEMSAAAIPLAVEGALALVIQMSWGT